MVMTAAERTRPTTIFISYRRDDSRPFALLLKYELEKHLQFVRVFLDTTDIRPGDPFPEAIRRTIADADVVVALIGTAWMPRRGGAPRARRYLGEEKMEMAPPNGRPLTSANIF